MPVYKLRTNIWNNTFQLWQKNLLHTTRFGRSFVIFSCYEFTLREYNMVQLKFSGKSYSFSVSYVLFLMVRYKNTI
jgi:hypothetical protein